MSTVVRTSGPMPLVLIATQTGVEARRELNSVQDEILGAFSWTQIEKLLKERPLESFPQKPPLIEELRKGRESSPTGSAANVGAASASSRESPG